MNQIFFQMKIWNTLQSNVKNKIKERFSNLDVTLIEILLKVNLNNMASFPFGLKMWYNIIICYKRKYSFSYKLKGTTCKILNVQEGRREKERTKWSFPAFFCRNCFGIVANNTIHANSIWFTYLFEDKNSNVLFGAKFPSLSLPLSLLSLSLSQIPFNNGLVKLTMNSSDQDFS